MSMLHSSLSLGATRASRIALESDSSCSAMWTPQVSSPLKTESMFGHTGPSSYISDPIPDSESTGLPVAGPLLSDALASECSSGTPFPCVLRPTHATVSSRRVRPPYGTDHHALTGKHHGRRTRCAEPSCLRDHPEAFARTASASQIA